MDEYQSIELHHGASYTYYDSYVDGWPDDIPSWSQPPHTTGINGSKIKRFDESTFSGGSIAFIDNEDISFYKDKLKHVDPDNIPSYGSDLIYRNSYGSPVEIDRKYLGMLLGAKKLKTSLGLNFSVSVPEDYNGVLTIFTNIQGTVEGSFDYLTLQLTDRDFYNGIAANPEHSALWFKRDTTSKAAQLDSSSEKLVKNSASVLESGVVESPGNYFWFYSPDLDQVALPSIRFLSMLYFPVDRDEEGNYLPNDPINYSASENHPLAGNFNLNFTVEGNFDSYLNINCRVGFIVVTPTKVHLFPLVHGEMRVSLEGVGVGFTAVQQETYVADVFSSGNSFRLPPLASSQITFLGAQVPIYFFYQVADEEGGFPTHEGATCAGTSFDISVEEEY